MIYDNTPKWIRVGAPIDKRGMNIAAQFSFGLLAIVSCHIRTNPFCVFPKKIFLFLPCLGDVLSVFVDLSINVHEGKVDAKFSTLASLGD